MNRYFQYSAICFAVVGLLAGGAFLATSSGSLSTVAHAQDNDSSSVVKVIGYGDAEATADTVSVKLSTGGGGAFYGPDGPEFEPVEEESLVLIVDALTESGIVADDIAVDAFGASFYGPNATSAEVRFDYKEPTNLSVFLVDVMDLIKDSRGPKIQSASAIFMADDCAALEAAAMQAALDNARARAEMMAAQMQVTLGKLTSVSEMPPNASFYGTTGASNCSTIEAAIHQAGFGGAGLGTNSADIVEVSINIEATFEIK